MSGYTPHIQYEFTVCGERLAIIDWGMGPNTGVRTLWIEELAKNGQEDTHMSGVVVHIGGCWAWLEGEQMFIDYGSLDFACAILEYLDENPFPEELL